MNRHVKEMWADMARVRLSVSKCLINILFWLITFKILVWVVSEKDIQKKMRKIKKFALKLK